MRKPFIVDWQGLFVLDPVWTPMFIQNSLRDFGGQDMKLQVCKGTEQRALMKS